MAELFEWDLCFGLSGIWLSLDRLKEEIASDGCPNQLLSQISELQESVLKVRNSYNLKIKEKL